MLENLKVNYLKNLRDSTSIIKTINDVFEEIKSDKHKVFTLELNKLYQVESEMYSIKKKNLPVVTFSALFEENNRRKEGIISYNKLLVIDIDKLNIDTIESVKKKLDEDVYVIANWVSPSGAGLKGIVMIKFIETKLLKENVDFHHKRAFSKISHYFLERYAIELDKSGNDYTRLCFISWSSINIKKSYSNFEINSDEYLEPKSKSLISVKLDGNKKKGDKKKFVLHNDIGKNAQSNKRQIIKIINFLKNEKKSITYSYDDWLRVAFGISNAFTFDLGKRYFIELSRLDETKFNENLSLNLLEDCYYNSKGTIKFSTIIHMARQQGYK